MEHPLPALLNRLGWTLSGVPTGLDRRVPGTEIAHVQPHALEVVGETGFVVLPSTDLAHRWMDALEDAAVAATLVGARWALVADPATIVAVDAWKRLALPTQRVAWMDRLGGPRTTAWLDSSLAGKGFPAAPTRNGSWTHWMAPLGITQHDGDSHTPTGPTAWLDAAPDGRFVLRAGSHVARRLAPSLIQRPDNLARVLTARAGVGLRATLDPDLLASCSDSEPLSKATITTLVTGGRCNDIVLHLRQSATRKATGSNI